MKYLKLLLLSLIIAVTTSAQTIHTSPFKRLTKPQTAYGGILGGSNEQTALRFSTGAGPVFYNSGEIKLVSHLDYGLHRVHYVDSTQKFYDDFSIEAGITAGGNVTPSFKDNTILGFNVGIGLFNQLIKGGIVYDLPTSNKGGKIGYYVGLGIPFNN